MFISQFPCSQWTPLLLPFSFWPTCQLINTGQWFVRILERAWECISGGGNLISSFCLTKKYTWTQTFEGLVQRQRQRLNTGSTYEKFYYSTRSGLPWIVNLAVAGCSNRYSKFNFQLRTQELQLIPECTVSQTWGGIPAEILLEIEKIWQQMKQSIWKWPHLQFWHPTSEVNGAAFNQASIKNQFLLYLQRSGKWKSFLGKCG